jgi:hypothetical protein
MTSLACIPKPTELRDNTMHANDMILISIDDHLIGPPTIFDNHLPTTYADRGPKLLPGPNGAERWIFEGVEIGSVGHGGV